MALPCPSSADSVSIVDSCPLTLSEWRQRALVKKCSMYPQTCNNKPLVYHCLLNPYANESLELCAPWTWLDADYCPSYNLKEKRILEQFDCTSLLPDCPKQQYNSTFILNHLGCLKELHTRSTISDDNTISSMNQGLIPVVIIGILIILSVLAISIFLMKRKKRWCFIERKDEKMGELPDKNDSNQLTPLLEQKKTNESLKETNEEILKKRIENQGASTEKQQGEDVVPTEKKSSSTEDSKEENADQTILARNNSHDEARVCLHKIEDSPQTQRRKETQDVMASVITLDEFMQQAGVPNKKYLKVQVVARDAEISYKTKLNEDKVLVNCVIADASKAVKCTVYDSSKFERFAEGKSLIMRNVIKEPGKIVVTIRSEVFQTSEVKLSQELYEQGRHILHPPPAPIKTLEEAKASQPTIKVSVRGKVVQVEASIERPVKGGRAKVKNILIEDSTSKCKVALWRTLAEEEIRPGDLVHITDVVIHNFRNEISLKSTYNTKISITKV